jgi:hypothetical protein
MKVQQTVTREGDDLVLTITMHPSGKVLGRRVWKQAAKYLRPEHQSLQGYLTIMIPERSGLNIKPS